MFILTQTDANQGDISCPSRSFSVVGAGFLFLPKELARQRAKPVERVLVNYRRNNRLGLALDLSLACFQLGSLVYLRYA